MAGFADGGGGGGRRAPFVVVAVDTEEAVDDARIIGGGVDAAGGPELKFFCLLSAAMRSASVENWGSSTSVMVRRVEEAGGAW